MLVVVSMAKSFAACVHVARACVMYVCVAVRPWLVRASCVCICLCTPQVRELRPKDDEEPDNYVKCLQAIGASCLRERVCQQQANHPATVYK
jgi:hypothetical protein